MLTFSPTAIDLYHFGGTLSPIRRIENRRWNHGSQLLHPYHFSGSHRTYRRARFAQRRLLGGLPPVSAAGKLQKVS